MNNDEIYKSLLKLKGGYIKNVPPKVKSGLYRHKSRRILPEDKLKELEERGLVEIISLRFSGYERAKITERGERFRLDYGKQLGDKEISEEK